MKYSTIYIDPPWRTKAGRPFNGYTMQNGKQIFTSASNKSRSLAYPTMTVAEIAALPVRELTNANAHLYMWATNQYLPEAFAILKSWGFKYSTTLVWAKNPMGGGLGGAYRITTEFLLFAKRGGCRQKKQRSVPGSIRSVHTMNEGNRIIRANRSSSRNLLKASHQAHISKCLHAGIAQAGMCGVMK